MTRPRHPTHLRRHVGLAAVAALVALGTIEGVALAQTRSAPVGTGVVVIETNLSYEGSQAEGTGMVLSAAGEILTNNHVIRGATTIKVVVPGTGHSYGARVVGYDISDDVAVLRLSGASNLRKVSLGNSAAVKVGQSVTAVGNAGGTGSLTSSTGAVTGIGRGITVSNESGGTARLTGLIETNARLEPGDSGGPLLNAAHKVVGMDTAASVTGFAASRAARTDGYAIPINKAVAIAKQIEAGKASAKVHIGGTAFLGVSVAAGDQGVVVEAVVPGGAAANAGIVPGDVITAFNGHAVSAPSKLGSLVAAAKAGSRVPLAIVDETGAARTVTITLGSGPPQ